MEMEDVDISGSSKKLYDGTKAGLVEPYGKTVSSKVTYDAALHFWDDQTLMPRLLTDKKCTWNGRRSRDKIEVPGAVTSEEYPTRHEVLNRETKRVKFNSTIIIANKLTNINQVFDNMRCDEDIIKSKRFKGVDKMLWSVLVTGMECPSPTETVEYC
ncbi:hypothetical protein Tco_0509073 [Tanacetum coccineum]